jgi:NAD(P)-dependent dehydrogenase (short-subunit alcohol dehydrogenase family)
MRRVLVTAGASGIGLVIARRFAADEAATTALAARLRAEWSVTGLMKTVAMEDGPRGIHANAILPGAVNGPRIDRVFEAEAAQKGMTVKAIREGYAAGTALRSLVDPEEVAEMAVFLASRAAKMVTGQAIAVDGFTINPDPQV